MVFDSHSGLCHVINFYKLKDGYIPQNGELIFIDGKNLIRMGLGKPGKEYDSVQEDYNNIVIRLLELGGEDFMD